MWKKAIYMPPCACCRLELKRNGLLERNNSLVLIKLKVDRGDASDNSHSNLMLCVRGKELFSQSYANFFGYEQEA